MEPSRCHQSHQRQRLEGLATSWKGGCSTTSFYWRCRSKRQRTICYKRYWKGLARSPVLRNSCPCNTSTGPAPRIQRLSTSSLWRARNSLHFSDCPLLTRQLRSCAECWSVASQLHCWQLPVLRRACQSHKSRPVHSMRCWIDLELQRQQKWVFYGLRSWEGDRLRRLVMIIAYHY